MYQSLLHRAVLLGTMLGAIAAPIDAATPCQCSHSQGETSCQNCPCCKAASKSARSCCQKRSCCKKAEQVADLASTARSGLRCCCKHQSSPVVPQPGSSAQQELKQNLVLAPLVVASGSVLSVGNLHLDLADSAPWEFRSLQSRFCRWTV